MKTNSAAVTLSQLADLVATDRSALCRNPRLPEGAPVHTGAAHRPEHAFALDALAAFAYDQTAHLTEAECRLRLALIGRTEPSRTSKRTCAKPGPFRLLDNGDGTHEMVPILEPDEFTLTEQRGLRAAVMEQSK
ncbi:MULTISPECIES: hypothetical protein [Pseudomonas]|uniref:Uncharacterized protein n=1 Tax=Pseudomonas putida NBRC 14164 TaxID=1211579 RepID=A0ABM7EEF0_PSEPU|nr:MULTISPECIES: hypothetical protein [Pseudomonas]MCX9135590.1 hypothetical protein [Pseudomonas sp. DCB_PUT]MDD1969583.1 hypothetical protein [Pseudomonas putida]MDO1464814.1 hypothetical protein [Pseudomonas putida]MDO1470184.1 hypothetical protein [Pseudomonas putida]MDZ7325906.1 hypothetical protein [Pseudomonas sp. SDS3-8]